MALNETPPIKKLDFAGATTIACGAALLIALVLLLLWVSFGNLTNRESGLLGTMLTIASSAFGAFLTHIYAKKTQVESIAEVQEQHNKNLKTYALKASEKVNNLSKELHRLVIYLEEELNETSYANVPEELSAKEERIQSAIHIIHTLRSMNDTSLSDWQGVIGEELAEKRAEEEDREEEIIGLIKRVNALHVKAEFEAQESAPNEYLSRQMESIRREIRALGSATTNISVRTPRKSKYEALIRECPNCHEPVTYRQRAKEDTPKALNCPHCSIPLISTYLPSEVFELRIRQMRVERINCPKCNRDVGLILDELLSASKRIQCDSCSSFLDIARTKSGLKTSAVPISAISIHALTEAVIEKVKNTLPVQPWPKGVHLEVAKTLDLPHALVQKAINALIQRGEVHEQVNGVICTTQEKIALMRNLGKDI